MAQGSFMASPRLMAGYVTEFRIGYSHSQSRVRWSGWWLLDSQMDPKIVSKSVPKILKIDPEVILKWPQTDFKVTQQFSQSSAKVSSDPKVTPQLTQR